MENSVKLPIPVHMSFHVDTYDLGFKKGLGIQYKCGSVTIRNAVQSDVDDFDYEPFRQILLQWFWRRLGAA